jgi:chromosome segregation and condensation protein ScpB
LPIPDIPKRTEDDRVSQQNIVETMKEIINKKKQLENRGYNLESASDGYLETQSDFNNARRKLQELVYDAYGLSQQQIDTISDVYELDL